MECFGKIINSSFYPLTIFTKHSILDVWQGSQSASERLLTRKLQIHYNHTTTGASNERLLYVQMSERLIQEWASEICVLNTLITWCFITSIYMINLMFSSLFVKAIYKKVKPIMKTILLIAWNTSVYPACKLNWLIVTTIIVAATPCLCNTCQN